MTRPERTVLLALGLLLALAGVEPVQGQDDGGSSEGALFLLLPTDPKAVGLGRAVTALPGPESVWWNPAGLARLDESRFLLFRGDNFRGEATAVSLTLARPGIGTGAISYQLLDFGSILQTDRDGNVVGEVSFREHLAVLSLATSLLDRVSLGVNLKLIQDRFSCKGSSGECVGEAVTGTTFAVDAGVQTHDIGGYPLRLGALLAHAGPDLQVQNREQADPLPTRVRVSAAYQVLDLLLDLEEEALQLWLTAELDDRWEDPGKPAKYFGAEAVAGTGSQVLRLRAGYVLDAQTQVDAAAVGLGLRWESFDLAIAKSLASSIVATESEPVHVSFGFVF